MVFCGVKYEEESLSAGLPPIKMSDDNKSFTIYMDELNDASMDMTMFIGKKGQFCNRNNKERSVPDTAHHIQLPRRGLESIDRPRKRADGYFTFIVVGAVPCTNPGQPKPSSTNSELITACAGNSITASPTVMWPSLKVDDFVSTVIYAASLSSAHNPDAKQTPTADIGSALASAAQQTPKVCAVQDKCEAIQCSDVKGTLPKDDTSALRWYGYNGYVGLSNLWYVGWKAVTEQAPLADVGGVVQTFFEKPDSGAKW